MVGSVMRRLEARRVTAASVSSAGRGFQIATLALGLVASPLWASSFVEGSIEGTIGGASEGSSASSGSSSGDQSGARSAFVEHNMASIVVHAARRNGASLDALGHLYGLSNEAVAERLLPLLPQLTAESRSNEAADDAQVKLIDSALTAK